MIPVKISGIFAQDSALSSSKSYNNSKVCCEKLKCQDIYINANDSTAINTLNWSWLTLAFAKESLFIVLGTSSPRRSIHFASSIMLTMLGWMLTDITPSVRFSTGTYEEKAYNYI